MASLKTQINIVFSLKHSLKCWTREALKTSGDAGDAGDAGETR